MSATATLREMCRKIHNIHHAVQYLSWDEAVMMPVGGGESRSESLATLRQLSHEFLTCNEMGESIEAARLEDSTNAWDSANLRVLEHQRSRALAIPSDLVAAISKATSACEQVWREKRQENDWLGVLPYLSEVVNLTRQRAKCLGETLALDPYDALLDEYEPGLCQGIIDPLFEELLDFLPDFVDDVLAAQGPRVQFEGDFSPTAQMKLAKKLMVPLGFNFSHGRIDTSHHPFSCGEHTDTRITTRFGSDDFLESMFAVLHETGHALYQQGLPPEWRNQPVGQSLGMIIHESQSLFMEMQICRSDAYLAFAMPIIEQALGIRGNGTSWTLDNLTKAVRRVERGKIRVDADEATYPLHVVLRYGLEKKILSDDLKLEDLPSAWNSSMLELFNIKLNGDNRDGCMQDVHWYAGLIGYFPCYSLGALTAAQFFRALVRDLDSVEEEIRNGKFKRVLGWQRENIHSRGQLVSSFDLISLVTGEALSTQAFVEHVSTRYGQNR